jgi:hypothetical protein
VEKVRKGGRKGNGGRWGALDLLDLLEGRKRVSILQGSKEGEEMETEEGGCEEKARKKSERTFQSSGNLSTSSSLTVTMSSYTHSSSSIHITPFSPAFLKLSSTLSLHPFLISSNTLLL